MGRDGVLPKRFFGYLKPGSNILLRSRFVGAVLIYHMGNAYEHGGELLNFGASLSFAGGD